VLGSNTSAARACAPSVALPPIQWGIDGVEATERTDADMMTIPKLKQLCVLNLKT